MGSGEEKGTNTYRLLPTGMSLFIFVLMYVKVSIILIHKDLYWLLFTDEAAEAQNLPKGTHHISNQIVIQTGPQTRSSALSGKLLS